MFSLLADSFGKRVHFDCPEKDGFMVFNQESVQAFDTIFYGGG